MEKSVNVTFFLLGGVMLTSMAGLEFCASLVMLFALINGVKEKKGFEGLKTVLFVSLPLLFFSLFSLAYNQHFSDIPTILGWFRWILFLLASVYLLSRYTHAATHLIKGLYLGISLAFVNSVVQYVTHYDFVRKIEIGFFADLTKETTRVTGFFNIPTTFGYVLSMVTLVPLALLLANPKGSQRYWHLAMFVISAVTLALTYTRGAWISFIVGMMLFLFLEYRRLFLPTALVLSTLAASGVALSAGFRERVTSLLNPYYYSNSQRIELWIANWEIFKDYPFFGLGLHKNDKLVEVYHLVLGHEEAFVSHAHNTYIQFLSSTGLFGLAAFLLFVGYFMIKGVTSWKDSPIEVRWAYAGLLSICVSFLISCLFDCNFRDAEVRYSYLVYLSLLVAVINQPQIVKNFLNDSVER